MYPVSESDIESDEIIDWIDKFVWKTSKSNQRIRKIKLSPPKKPKKQTKVK